MVSRPVSFVVNASSVNAKRMSFCGWTTREGYLLGVGFRQAAGCICGGVVRCLQRDQRRGLALFWAHDLEKLGRFIASTRIDRG